MINLQIMYSIIVCSIRPEEAMLLKKSVEATIGEGIPVEFIIHDNRGTGKGMCQVYNECAAKARYDYLCFVHEDVEFVTEGWGRLIADKLAEPDCGVIGFAGSAMKSRYVTGWNSTRRYGVRAHYVQGSRSGERVFDKNPYNQKFSQVVVLDGMCLFAHRRVWERNRFDEQLLKGFHCYDVDFTLAAADSGFRNWVANTVYVKHKSEGSYNHDWFKDNVKMHRKWKKSLPMYVKDKGNLKRRYYEFRSRNEWAYKMGVRNIYDECRPSDVAWYMVLHPFNSSSFRFLKGYLKNKNRKVLNGRK